MVEQFRAAGHKAPTLTTAIALEETFEPIQRVKHNDKTIGYLFRNVEYQNGSVEDIVLAYDIFRDKSQDPIIKSLPEWRTYLANAQNNPYDFHIPSGPLMMELTYRMHKDNSTLHDEITKSIHETYEHWLALNTTIDYNKLAVHHTYLNNEQKQKIKNALEKHHTILTDDIDVTTQAFLTALFGRRAPHANTIFSTDPTPVEIWTPSKEDQTSERALVLSVSNYDGSVRIYANRNINGIRRARGVAPAKRILNMPGVKVCDD